MVEWREDLKSMLKKAGADPGIPNIFLFSDTQIKDEGFVEDINNLLNSGEVRQQMNAPFLLFSIYISFGTGMISFTCNMCIFSWELTDFPSLLLSKTMQR